MPKDEYNDEPYEPNEDEVRGIQTAYAVFGQEVRKRANCSDEEWKTAVDEVTENKGNVLDLAERFLGKREATAEEKRSGVDPAKEAKAKKGDMSVEEAREAFIDDDISTEAYQESGHAPKN